MPSRGTGPASRVLHVAWIRMVEMCVENGVPHASNVAAQRGSRANLARPPRSHELGLIGASKCLVAEIMSFTSCNARNNRGLNNMKFHTLPIGLIFALSLIGGAQAQGVPGGIAHGAAVGNQAAGPVGAVVGGAVGGVIGGVEGVLGIDHRPSYWNYSEEHPEYRRPRADKGVRYSRHVVRHPVSYSR